MSLNKVLNRPLFRQQALRKGALKPIHAESGRMIGMNVPGGAQNYVQKGGGFYDPTTGRLIGGLPAPVNAARGPGFFSKLKADIPAALKNFKDPRFLINAPFGMGGGTTRTAGAFGLYPLIEEGTRKLGLTGYSKLAADAAISMGLSRNPYAAGIGLLYGGYRTARPLVGRGIDLIKERPLGTTASNKNFMPGVEGVLGDPIEQVSFEEMVKSKGRGRYGPREPSQTADSVPPKPIPDNMNRIVSGRGAGDATTTVGYKEFDTAIAGTDQLTKPENETRVGNTDVVDLEKIVKNASLAEDENIVAPKDEGLLVAPGIESKPTAPIEEPKETKEQAEKNLQKQAAALAIGQAPGTDEVFTLARKYFNELQRGQTSQAQTVFLATLASGLMQGTTRKSGLGGALEVLGAALGPAVSNMATIKLKEGEMRQSAREASLSAALDQMKLYNTNVDNPEQTTGIIQIRGVDGELKNISGFIRKDATITRPVVDAFGNQRFEVVVQGADLQDAQGNPIGRVEKFLPQKEVSNRQFEISDVLGNRYTAYATTLDVLDTLNELTPEGEKKKAGVGLTLDTLVRRTTGVAKEIFGIELGETLGDAEAVLNRLYNDEAAAIDRDPDLSGAEKEKLKKELLNSEKFKKESMKRISERSGGFFSGLTRPEQEKLAVQETSLIYALANTFKDQDRLTQRDIDAARKIVNIFSLSRSSEDVRASIEAIAKQLESDILRQERLFTQAGGLYSGILDLRKLKDFRPGTAVGTITPNLYKAFTEEEIKKGLEGVNL